MFIAVQMYVYACESVFTFVCVPVCSRNSKPVNASVCERASCGVLFALLSLTHACGS